MTSTEDELATDIAAILADHKDVAGGAAAVTTYLMPIIAAEADFAARAARAENEKLRSIIARYNKAFADVSSDRDRLSIYRDIHLELLEAIHARTEQQEAAE